MPWVDIAEVVTADPPSERERRQVFEWLRHRTKPRFYADENLPVGAVQILRAQGCRVVTVQDLLRRGHPDENHAAYALRKGLILLTCDRDYLDERRFPLIHCPAIIVFDFGPGPLTVMSIRRAFRCLVNVIKCPQVYDKWIKIHASRDCWTEYARFLNGTTSK